MRTFNPDSSGGGGAHAGNPIEKPVPAFETAPVPGPVPTPDPAPPAAATVLSGTHTEENILLRESLRVKDTEIEELKRQVKDREISVCEYQDKLEALKNPVVIPIRRKSPESRPFRLGYFQG